MAKRGGFTLIELMVVVTIVGILIGLLFPVYSTVMRTAQETYCQSNLSELAKVVIAYCQANDGHFPFIGSTLNDVMPSASDWLYVNYTTGAGEIHINSSNRYPFGDLEHGALLKNKLIGKVDVLYCPVDVDLGLKRGTSTNEDPVERYNNNLTCQIVGTSTYRPATSYVINSSITYGDSTPRRVHRISDFGAWTFMFIEESSGDTANGEMDSPCNRAFMGPMVDGHVDPRQHALTSRHRWGGYVACMDGHVEWMLSGNPDPKNPNYVADDTTTFEAYRTQLIAEMGRQNRAAWYYTTKTRWNP